MPRAPTRAPRAPRVTIGTADNPLLVDERGRVDFRPRAPTRAPRAPRVAIGTAVNPLLVDERGRVVRSLNEPRRRRAREIRYISPTYRANTTHHQPLSPSLARTRIRRPHDGKRAPRDETQPLEGELYLDALRPPVQMTDDTDLHCVICFHVKSHPVRAKCAHSYCFVCIRQWLQLKWSCPTCRKIMYSAPTTDGDMAAAVARGHPGRKDLSRVNYAWDGLTFPVKCLPPISYSP
ncbi:hypothetical protein C8R46DRAFT_1215458 [Mycena filopes]|nr:hypothetical protein C8R46DRAFT_1215458 [Mycena filopes]